MSLSIGQSASMVRRFTQTDVLAFSRVTGDNNPLHTDPDYARRTTFGRPIVHGLLTAGLFSRLLGTALPGPGSVYVGQLLKFLKPVYIDEEITATVEVAAIDTSRNTVRLYTRAVTARGTVVDGEAVMALPRTVSASG